MATQDDIKNFLIPLAPLATPVAKRPVGAVDGQVVVEAPEIPAWAMALSTAGTAIGAYHGYKRNDSVGWAIGWALLGGFAPVIVIPLAFAQGLSKRKGK